MLFVLGRVVGMKVLMCLLFYWCVVFFFDVYLGLCYCYVIELVWFLVELCCEWLYLVGDIIDLWWMVYWWVSWWFVYSDVI